MTIRKVSAFEAVNTAHDLIEEKREEAIVNISDRIWAAAGRESGYDAEVLEKDGILVFQSCHFGGTCIIFEGDLAIFIYENGQTFTSKEFIHAVANKLSADGHDVKIAGNDILLKVDDDYRKVASEASTWFGNGLVSVMHVSINTDEELIRKYCSKPMIKRPGEIGSLGYTADDFVPLLYSVLGVAEE